MSLTVFEGLQSEIYVPITPKSIFTPVTKPLSEMVIALASACGAHLKTDKRFNLAGDTTYREIPDNTPTDDLMISHGGYDNSDANRDINLAKAGFIKGTAPTHFGFMGGGGDQTAFHDKTGPAIAQKLKDENVDGVILTAG